MLLIRSFDSLERLGEYKALFFLKGFTEFGFCIMKDILVSFDEALYSVLQFTFSLKEKKTKLNNIDYHTVPLL